MLVVRLTSCQACCVHGRQKKLHNTLMSKLVEHLTQLFTNSCMQLAQLDIWGWQVWRRHVLECGRPACQRTLRHGYYAVQHADFGGNFCWQAASKALMGQQLLQTLRECCEKAQECHAASSQRLFFGCIQFMPRISVVVHEHAPELFRSSSSLGGRTVDTPVAVHIAWQNS